VKTRYGNKKRTADNLAGFRSNRTFLQMRHSVSLAGSGVARNYV